MPTKQARRTKERKDRQRAPIKMIKPKWVGRFGGVMDVTNPRHLPQIVKQKIVERYALTVRSKS